MKLVLKKMEKQFKGKAGIKGWFTLKHIRAGNIIEERTIDNTVVNTGRAQVAGLLLTDVGGTAFDYIAIGTGTTAAAVTDTTLGTEITTGGGERTAGTGTRVTTSVANDTAQLVVTFTFTGSFAVTESGVLNAGVAGVLLSRQTFGAINVVSGDSIEVTWKIQVS